MKSTILERFTSTGKILESDKKNLPNGVLCRAKYQICSVGEKNRNNRIYEREVWERVLADQDIIEKLKNRSLFFHAEHPATTQSNTEKVAGIVTDIDLSENKVHAIMEVLDTPYGRIVDTLLKAGCGIGVSTRADGELEEAIDEDGNKYSRVVPQSYKFVTVDFTADPSSYGSEVPIEVQRNVAEVVKVGIDNEKIDRDYATVLLEHLDVDEARTILESMKNDKHHEDCKCKPSEKHCLNCGHVNENKITYDYECDCGNIVKGTEETSQVCTECDKAMKRIAKHEPEDAIESIEETKSSLEKRADKLAQRIKDEKDNKKADDLRAELDAIEIEIQRADESINEAHMARKEKVGPYTITKRYRDHAIPYIVMIKNKSKKIDSYATDSHEDANSMFDKYVTRAKDMHYDDLKNEKSESVKEESKEDLSKEHPGAYCEKCGKTATVGEYSKGECECGGDIVAESINEMKKLGQRLYSLLSMSIKTSGSYAPDEVLPMIEEELTPNEYDQLEAFLTWVDKNNKKFGSGNYEERFKEFLGAKESVDETKYTLKALRGTSPTYLYVDTDKQTVNLRGEYADLALSNIYVKGDGGKGKEWQEQEIKKALLSAKSQEEMLDFLSTITNAKWNVTVEEAFLGEESEKSDVDKEVEQLKLDLHAAIKKGDKGSAADIQDRIDGLIKKQPKSYHFPEEQEGEEKKEKFEESISEVVKKVGDKWQVQSHSGKNMGTYDTEAEAKKRLGQVEFFKHQNEAKLSSEEKKELKRILKLKIDDVKDEEDKKLLNKYLSLIATAGEKRASEILSEGLEDFVTPGGTQIWYWKDEYARDALMGSKWLKDKGILPDPNDLEKTHTLLGSIESKDLDDIYSQMQGERWSPRGEARGLIQELGLTHTSMSVGDIAVVDGNAYLVDSLGFYDLTKGVDFEQAKEEKVPMTAYHWGEAKPDELDTIDRSELQNMEKLTDEDLLGMNIRPEDKGKTFYAYPNDIERTDDEGTGVKWAYAIKESIRENRRAPQDLIDLVKDYYKDVTTSGKGKKAPKMSRAEAIKHLALITNRSEDEVKKILKEDVQMVIQAPDEKINQFLNDNWSQFLSDEDAVNNLVKVFKINASKAKSFVDKMSKGKGNISLQYAMEKKRLIENYGKDCVRFSKQIRELKEKVASDKLIFKSLEEARNKLSEECSELRVFEKKAKEDIKVLKEMVDEANDKFHKALDESEEKIINLKESHKKEVLNTYTETKLKCMGLKLNERRLTILESCKTAAEVDELIREFQNSITESALQFSGASEINISVTQEKKDPKQAEIDRKVGSAMSAWTGGSNK